MTRSTKTERGDPKKGSPLGGEEVKKSLYFWGVRGEYGSQKDAISFTRMGTIIGTIILFSFYSSLDSDSFEVHEGEERTKLEVGQPHESFDLQKKRLEKGGKWGRVSFRPSGGATGVPLVINVECGRKGKDVLKGGVR